MIETKTELKKLRAMLCGADVVTDDGAESGDAEQNRAFSASVERIEDIRRTVAAIDVDGVDCDKLWKDSIKSLVGLNPHAPEHLYMQTVAYIDSVLDEIEKGEK